MISMLRTIWLVFLHAFHKRITVQYPEQKPYLAPRFRGRIILSRDPDGGERCVACNLCAVACPVDCIALQATEDETGRRLPEFFRINFSRCIFCGYCEEACPTYAIQLHDEVRDPIPMKPGSVAKRDSEYERCGTANVFCGIEPQAGVHYESDPDPVVAGIRRLHPI